MKPTDKEAQQAWKKFSKSVWFHTTKKHGPPLSSKEYGPGMPLSSRGGKKMQFAFREGYHWTRYKQHPAVETDDKEWMIVFKKTKDGEIVGDIVKTPMEESTMKDEIKKALNLFEDDHFVDAKDIIAEKVKSRRNQFLTDKLGLDEKWQNEGMNFLSDKVKDKDFKNVDVNLNPSQHSMMGTDSKVLYLNIEPYNKEITDKYKDKLISKIKSKKKQILKEFPGKEIIVVNDKVRL